MTAFIFFASVLYFIATLWYARVDRRNKKRVILIPSEFLFILLGVGAIVCFFLFIAPDFQIMPGFRISRERKLFIFSLILSVIMSTVHGIAKYLEDRRGIGHWKDRRQKVVRALHLRISHKLLYLSVSLTLYSAALSEIKDLVIYPQITSLKLIGLSAVLMSWSFYKTIIYGNTWRLERFYLPIFSLIILKSLIENRLTISEAPLAWFATVILLLTPLAIWFDKRFSSRLKGKILVRLGLAG